MLLMIFELLSMLSFLILVLKISCAGRTGVSTAGSLMTALSIYLSCVSSLILFSVILT